MNDQLTLFLLLALQAGGEIGCAEQLLLNRARAEVQPDLTEPALQATLRQLADKRWALDYKPALASKRWKLTELGLATLREGHLA